MGKHIKMRNVDLAYIAGFLDGDGSVMVQVKRRSDTSKGWRLMFTIVYYLLLPRYQPFRTIIMDKKDFWNWLCLLLKRSHCRIKNQWYKTGI